MRNFISRTIKELRTQNHQQPQQPIPRSAFAVNSRRRLPPSGFTTDGRRYGFSTTLMQPSCRSRNFLYRSGPSSRPPVCVTTNDGSISPCNDPVKQHRQVMLHRRLRHPECQAAINRRSHRYPVDVTAVDADNGNGPEIPATVNRLTQHMGTVGCQISRDLDPIDHRIPACHRIGLGADGIDARVRAPALCFFLNSFVDIIFLEIESFRAGLTGQMPTFLEQCRSLLRVQLPRGTHS